MESRSLLMIEFDNLCSDAMVAMDIFVQSLRTSFSLMFSVLSPSAVVTKSFSDKTPNGVFALCHDLRPPSVVGVRPSQSERLVYPKNGLTSNRHI